MKLRFSKVILICPEHVTGGPEAIHQLAYSINCRGGYARILYTNSKGKLTGSEAVGGLSPDSIIYKVYKEYDPRPVTGEQLSDDTILIFPEIWIDWCYSISQTTKARCACWWLSVDNAQTANQFSDQNVRTKFFNTVFQFAQSEYAKSFLKSTGAREIYKITDYTGRKFTYRGNLEQLCDWPVRRIPKSVAYFPQKGAELASTFQQKVQGIGLSVELRPIANMTRSQVIDLLLSTQVYIDFGHQPGKDRMPREAAALGCVILLNEVGAAAFFADHPLPAAYKFSKSDVASDNLVREVRRNFQERWSALYRAELLSKSSVFREAEFDRLVECFFFC